MASPYGTMFSTAPAAPKEGTSTYSYPFRRRQEQAAEKKETEPEPEPEPTYIVDKHTRRRRKFEALGVLLGMMRKTQRRMTETASTLCFPIQNVWEVLNSISPRTSIDLQGSIFVTATVERVCQLAVLCAIRCCQNPELNPASARKDKLTMRHFQVGLRSDPVFRELLHSTWCLLDCLNEYLDDGSRAALSHLGIEIELPGATHPSNKHTVYDGIDSRRQLEYEEHGSFTSVDVMMLSQETNSCYELSHDALAFLTLFSREVLATVSRRIGLWRQKCTNEASTDDGKESAPSSTPAAPSKGPPRPISKSHAPSSFGSGSARSAASGASAETKSGDSESEHKHEMFRQRETEQAIDEFVPESEVNVVMQLGLLACSVWNGRMPVHPVVKIKVQVMKGVEIALRTQKAVGAKDKLGPFFHEVTKGFQDLTLKTDLKRTDLVFLYKGRPIKDDHTPEGRGMSLYSQVDVYALPISLWSKRQGLLQAIKYSIEVVRGYRWGLSEVTIIGEERGGFKQAPSTVFVPARRMSAAERFKERRKSAEMVHKIQTEASLAAQERVRQHTAAAAAMVAAEDEDAAIDLLRQRQAAEASAISAAQLRINRLYAEEKRQRRILEEAKVREVEEARKRDAEVAEKAQAAARARAREAKQKETAAKLAMQEKLAQEAKQQVNPEDIAKSRKIAAARIRQKRSSTTEAVEPTEEEKAALEAEKQRQAEESKKRALERIRAQRAKEKDSARSGDLSKKASKASLGLRSVTSRASMGARTGRRSLDLNPITSVHNVHNVLDVEADTLHELESTHSSPMHADAAPGRDDPRYVAPRSSTRPWRTRPQSFRGGPGESFIKSAVMAVPKVSPAALDALNFHSPQRSGAGGKSTKLDLSPLPRPPATKRKSKPGRHSIQRSRQVSNVYGKHGAKGARASHHKTPQTARAPPRTKLRGARHLHIAPQTARDPPRNYVSEAVKSPSSAHASHLPVLPGMFSTPERLAMLQPHTRAKSNRALPKV